MKLWSATRENLPTARHALRTAGGATLSLIVARALRLPEPYWAAVATLLVMQSSLEAAVPVAAERIVATALGALTGGIEATFFGQNLVAFAVSIFVLGLISSRFRVAKTGYRYASITLAIVVLIPRVQPAWLIAVHRFVEVSIGVLVGLGVAAIWRDDD